ncbi:MAG TPA: hypothetical protein VFG29_06265 [Syntrophales bacterium]|nr:hypothetical protein [Syntrophales bacterium]
MKRRRSQGEWYCPKRSQEAAEGEKKNITAYADAVQYDYPKHTDEFTKPASNAISMSKKKSKGK